MSLIVSADLQRIAAGMHTTETASDLIDTGLLYVNYAAAQVANDPILTCALATAHIENQLATPGVIAIKTWEPAAPNDTTPQAATTFGQAVQWMALGR